MVPKRCDGPCKRNLMIWDVTQVSVRRYKPFYLCDDCMPKVEMIEEIPEKKLDLRYDPLAVDEDVNFAFTRKPEYDPGFSEPEDGSQDRFIVRSKHVPWRIHLPWWFVHNCISHPLIGILPFKPFFKLHDWTSRKMHER